MTLLEQMQDKVDRELKRAERIARETNDPKAPKTPEEWAYMHGLFEGRVILEAADIIRERAKTKEETTV